jgi:hypothetical protein
MVWVVRRSPRVALDWHRDPLSRETVVDEKYRLTQNVRRFFARELGEPVRFDRAFIVWLKASRGITLGAALDRWRSRRAAMRS